MNARRKEIDWEEVRARLRQGEMALERVSAPDPQKVEAVYRRRAAQLAGRPARAGAVSPPLSVLAFSLGEERYGIELTALAEVAPFAGCTPLPGASPEALGVVNARGEVRPVVDLARLIGLPEGGASGHVLFLRREGAGLRVGRVEEVRQVRPEELTAPGEGGVDLPIRCVKGLVPKTLILLDIEAILEHPIFREVLA